LNFPFQNNVESNCYPSDIQISTKKTSNGKTEIVNLLSKLNKLYLKILSKNI
jgi:hypothetical protein